MAFDEHFEPVPENNRTTIPDDADPGASTAADVESAGRSCMAIIVILGLIVVVLALWLILRSVGVGA